MGLVRMGDMLSPKGFFWTWAELLPGGGDRLGEKAYLSLLSNLHLGPLIDDVQGRHLLHFQTVDPDLSFVIWEYLVPPAETSSDWPRICRNFCPVRTFTHKDCLLTISRDVIPSPKSEAYMVLVRMPSGRAGRFSWFGRWNVDSLFVEQFGWKDESALLHTSTGQLRKMQTAHRFIRHKALLSGRIN